MLVGARHRGPCRATGSTPSSSSPPTRSPSPAAASRSTTARARRRRGSPGSGGASGRSASSGRSCPPPATAWSCAGSRRRTPWVAAACSTRGRDGTARAARPSRGSNGWLAAKRRNRPDGPSQPHGRRAKRGPKNPSRLRPSELEQRLRDAGVEPPIDSELDAGDLAALRDAGRAVRVSKALHYHADSLDEIRARLVRASSAQRWRGHARAATRRALDLAQVRAGAARALRLREGHDPPR